MVGLLQKAYTAHFWCVIEQLYFRVPLVLMYFFFSRPYTTPTQCWAHDLDRGWTAGSFWVQGSGRLRQTRRWCIICSSPQSQTVRPSSLYPHLCRAYYCCIIYRWNWITLQINRASSWIDGSFVYGSCEVWSNCLREFNGGSLLTSDHSGSYPGHNHLRLPLDNLPDPVEREQMDPEEQWGECLCLTIVGYIIIADLMTRWNNFQQNRLGLGFRITTYYVVGNWNARAN